MWSLSCADRGSVAVWFDGWVEPFRVGKGVDGVEARARVAEFHNL